MNRQFTRAKRSALGPYPLASVLVACFALLCAVLTAVGVSSSLSLRSIARLNSTERLAVEEAIGIPYRLGQSVDLEQVAVFRQVLATTAGERTHHEENISRLRAANANGLVEYGKTADNEAERGLFAEAQHAEQDYIDLTRALLALSRREQQDAGATRLAHTRQVAAYDRYRLALAAMLRFEEAESRQAVAMATGRVDQALIAGDALVVLAILLAFGTAVVVWKLVRLLGKDKKALQTKVESLEYAQQALHKGEVQYRLLVDHSPDAILVIREGEIKFVNPAALILLGADHPGRLIGRAPSEIVHPDECAAVAQRSLDVAAGKQPTTAERRMVRLDGSIVEVESHIVPFLFEGEPAIQVILRDNTEGKTAAEELNAQAKQYRLLFEDNPSPMWVYDVESLNILAVNEAVISSYGYSRAEFLSLSLRDIRPSEDVASLMESISDAKAPSGYGGEWRHRKKDGSIITAAVYSSPITFDNKGARMALAVDLTERVEAERKVRESEANLAHAQRVAGLGSWEYQIAADGQFAEDRLIWSQESYRLFGRSADDPQLTTADFLAAVHSDDRAFVANHLAAFKGNRVALNIDFRVVHLDGTEHVLYAASERITDPQTGQVIKIVGTLLDITQRRAVEKQLREADEKYRSIFENASEGIFQSSPEGAILSANPALARMLGFASPEELIRQRPDLETEGYTEPAQRREFKRLIEEEGVVANFEYELKRKDGSKVWVSENSRVVHDAAGRALFYEGTIQNITERKRAEEIRAESERRFRFLNDLSNATRSLSQPHEITAAVTRLLGIQMQASRCAYAEMEKDGDHFVVHGDYADGCASIAGRHRLADFGPHTESRLVAGTTVVLRDVDAELAPSEGADGFNSIQVKAMIACPLIKNGKLVAAIAVHDHAPRQWSDGEVSLVQEIVERCWSSIERARAAIVLRESEEHLLLVIAASNDGIFEHEFDAEVITWSDRMFEMLGLDRDHFVPTLASFTALLHPDDRASFQKSVREQITTGARYDAHTRIRRRDGSYGNFLSRGRVILDPAGKPVRIVGSVSDLTHLLRAEQKLVEQANLLNLAQDAIMVRDMDDRIEFWNYGAEVLYGWTAEEARGQLSGEFLHYEEPLKMLAERTLLQTGAWSGECRHLTKEGAPVVVRSRWTLVRDEHGKPKSKLIIATDMTEQKKIEGQFLRAQRLESIGTLASGVAHDLNNILVPIMMAAPVLRGEIDAAERDRFLDIVESSAHRGADIIRQVLTFARGADGDRILLQPIYLLDEVSRIASQTFPKSISLRTNYDENIHSLEADPTQLHQVLLNLCINARDAMPNGGDLCLGAENFDVDEQYAAMTPGATAGPHVLLEVTDTGNGIPKEIIEKIFDPFFTTKSVGNGTGLGLSTVAGIVKSHGGFIDISSEPGHTSFKIYLPAKHAVGDSAILALDPLVPEGHGETILLVDDEPTIREVAEVILNSHGYDVLVAEDGPTALALFAKHMSRISVVITDLAMPGMDGLLVVRTLRRIDPVLKIIVSTGRTDDSHALEMAALNIDGYLTKPYTTRSLLLKLSHVLQGSMQHAA